MYFKISIIKKGLTVEVDFLMLSKHLCRHEFFQKPEEVVVTIFAKNIPAQNIDVDYGEQIVWFCLFAFLLLIGLIID